jgi:hypothetical protein
MSKNKSQKNVSPTHINWAQYGLNTNSSTYQQRPGSDSATDNTSLMQGLPRHNELFLEDQVILIFTTISFQF